MAYAERTKTSISDTRAQIETLLGRHGATAFGFSQDGGVAQLLFRLGAYTYRFKVMVPEDTQQAKARWRAVLLVIKARLEGVAAGIETIEEAFLANTVMQGGATVSEWLKPEMEEAARLGRMPQRLMLEGPRNG